MQSPLAKNESLEDPYIFPSSVSALRVALPTLLWYMHTLMFTLICSRMLSAWLERRVAQTWSKLNSTIQLASFYHLQYAMFSNHLSESVYFFHYYLHMTAATISSNLKTTPHSVMRIFHGEATSALSV